MLWLACVYGVGLIDWLVMERLGFPFGLICAVYLSVWFWDCFVGVRITTVFCLDCLMLCLCLVHFTYVVLYGYCFALLWF